MGIFDELDEAFGRMLADPKLPPNESELSEPKADFTDQDWLAVDPTLAADLDALKSTLAGDTLIPIIVIAHHLSANGRKYWLSAFYGALRHHRQTQVNVEQIARVDRLIDLLTTGQGRIRKILRRGEADQLRQMALSLGGTCDHNQTEDTLRLVSALMISPSLGEEDAQTLFAAGIARASQAATASLTEIQTVTQMPQARLQALQSALAAFPAS